MKRYFDGPKRRYKIVVYVPEADSAKMSDAMGDAGAGKIGNYSHCTFTTKGTGKFKPLEGAKPTRGQIGKLEEVPEVRIETVCEADKLDAVLEAFAKAHPYEEPGVDVYPIEVIEQTH